MDCVMALEFASWKWKTIYSDGSVLSGSKAGTEVLLPRITFIPTDVYLPVKLKRRQFPIRVAFAMTINKSQGQTFKKVGLYLPNPVFTHGQLYVAFSRVKNPQSIKVQIGPIGSTESKTKNIVFKEILWLTSQSTFNYNCYYRPIFLGVVIK